MVRGAGTQTSDSIDAKLSKDESVLNAGATKALRAMLKKTGMTIDEFNELHAPKDAETKVVDGVLHAALGADLGAQSRIDELTGVAKKTTPSAMQSAKAFEQMPTTRAATAADVNFGNGIKPTTTPTIGTPSATLVNDTTIPVAKTGFLKGVANNLGGSMSLGTGIASEYAPKVFDAGVQQAMQSGGLSKDAPSRLFGGNQPNDNGITNTVDIASLRTPETQSKIDSMSKPPIASIAQPTATPDATAKVGVVPAAQAMDAVNTGMQSAKLGELIPDDKISTSRSTIVGGSLSPTDNGYPTPFDPKKLQSEEVQQAMSNNTAMVSQDLTGRGITKGVGVGKNGSTLYSDGGMANLATAPQVGAQPQKRLSEEQVRQLYRELPADSFSAAGMGGTTTQQRYDKQQLPENRLNIAPQVDPNAVRNALIAQSKQSGNVGDKAIRDSAKEQLAALDANARNEQDNKYKMASLGQNASQFEQQQQAAMATAKNAATKDEREYQLKLADQNKPFDVSTDTGQVDMDNKPIMTRQTMVKDKDGNFVPVKAKQQESTVTQADIDKKIANAVGLGFSQKEAIEALKLDHPEYFKGAK